MASDTEEGLQPVPILHGAICLGRSDRVTPHLLFGSERYGIIRLRIAPTRGGDFLYSYVIRDDRTGTATQFQGTHGDPERDEMVQGPFGIA